MCYQGNITHGTYLFSRPRWAFRANCYSSFWSNRYQILNHYRWAVWTSIPDDLQTHHIFKRSNIGSNECAMEVSYNIWPTNLAKIEQSLWLPLQCKMIASTILIQLFGVLYSFSAKSFMVIWMKMLKLSLFLLPIPLIFPFKPIRLT